MKIPFYIGSHDLIPPATQVDLVLRTIMYIAQKFGYKCDEGDHVQSLIYNCDLVTYVIMYNTK